MNDAWSFSVFSLSHFLKSRYFSTPTVGLFNPPYHLLLLQARKYHSNDLNLRCDILQMAKKMGGVDRCMETAPSPVLFPQKPCHCPKLETIREDRAEEEQEDIIIPDLNFNWFFQFWSAFLLGLPKKLVRQPPRIILDSLVRRCFSLQNYSHASPTSLGTA
ncbi:hypothetical protein Pfo_007229 [Paulownia fortunei]|nr:hypothetical protein Pfo_007229 [Paulownia fortunei]